MAVARQMVWQRKASSTQWRVSAENWFINIHSMAKAGP
jgi:hypothetical protein